MTVRKNATKSTLETATVEKTTVADTSTVDLNDKIKSKVSKKESVKAKPLQDSDEIEVTSFVPNVSYKDSKTNDMYEWDEVGHVELMTVETLKNMWRNHKGYFRNMWLKPNDDRIIKQFGLTSNFEKYEYLMDESNYTRSKISEICKVISSAPNGLKFAICNKVKNLVQEGKIIDISVIRALEKHLNLDLTSFF